VRVEGLEPTADDIGRRNSCGGPAGPQPPVQPTSPDPLGPTKNDTDGEVIFVGTRTLTNPVFQAWAEGKLCILQTSPSVTKMTKTRMALR
jgi:hypothetical protein